MLYWHLLVYNFKGLYIIILTTLAASPGFILGNTYEDPPVFSASEVLPAELLKGTHHKVGDSVTVVRYGYQFELETESGTQVVWSKALLQRRIQEAEAIAERNEAASENSLPVAFARRSRVSVFGR